MNEKTKFIIYIVYLLTLNLIVLGSIFITGWILVAALVGAVSLFTSQLSAGVFDDIKEDKK